MNKKKIKKILVASAIGLLTLSGSAFAVDNNSTSIEDQIISDDIDAGYTPDNVVGYKFDRFGDWAKLQFAKLGSNDYYDEVENEVLQERLAELKLVNEEKRLELQEQIQEQIQDRKERKEQRLEELKERINERKQELNQNNVTSVIDDEDLNEIQKEISDVENELQSDDDEIRKKLKEVEQVRNQELEQLQKKLQEQQFEAREYERQLEQFKKENPELFQKYGSLIEDFDGETFKITTNKREIVAEVIGDNIKFKPSADIDDVDYEIQVRNEEELRDMMKEGNTDIEKIGDNVDAPLRLKTKIAYNIATLDNEEENSEE